MKKNLTLWVMLTSVLFSISSCKKSDSGSKNSSSSSSLPSKVEVTGTSGYKQTINFTYDNQKRLTNYFHYTYDAPNYTDSTMYSINYSGSNSFPSTYIYSEYYNTTSNRQTFFENHTLYYNAQNTLIQDSALYQYNIFFNYPSSVVVQNVFNYKEGYGSIDSSYLSNDNVIRTSHIPYVLNNGIFVKDNYSEINLYSYSNYSNPFYSLNKAVFLVLGSVVSKNLTSNSVMYTIDNSNQIANLSSRTITYTFDSGNRISSSTNKNNGTGEILTSNYYY